MNNYSEFTFKAKLFNGDERVATLSVSKFEFCLLDKDGLSKKLHNKLSELLGEEPLFSDKK